MKGLLWADGENEVLFFFFFFLFSCVVPGVKLVLLQGEEVFQLGLVDDERSRGGV